MSKKIDDSDIKLAINSLDVKDDAHWVEGKPNFLMLQEALGPELTVADVNRITGDADRIDIARARGIIMSVPDAPAPNQANESRAATKTAEQKFAEIEVKIGDNAGKREALQKELDGLNEERDRLTRVMQQGAQVSSADAVKAIQAQSMKAAQDRKNATMATTVAMRSTGLNPQYASKLDQDTAMRKRDPDHAKRHAAFIAQQAADRNAARG